MRRILVALAAIALAFAMIGPTVASADVTNFQVRTYGAEAWLTNMSADSPQGLYYDAYVQAYVAQDSRPGMSVDWVFFGYQVWEKRPNGDWAFRSDVSGYAPDGAAGLSMSVGDLAWATVKTSFPVGYCDRYEPEDAGGDCIKYVNVGTVRPRPRVDADLRIVELERRVPPGGSCRVAGQLSTDESLSRPRDDRPGHTPQVGEAQGRESGRLDHAVRHRGACAGSAVTRAAPLTPAPVPDSRSRLTRPARPGRPGYSR